MRKSAILVLAAASAILPAAVTAAPAAITGSVITEAGDRKTGVVKWSPRAKAYVVSVKRGNTMIDEEVAAGDVAELDIAKPAGFDQAVAQISKGQAPAAIPVLSGIVKTYAHLQWDRIAGRYLAEAYIAANNPEKALETCKSIIEVDKSAAWKGELAPAYWTVLLKTNQKQALEAALKKAAKSGDRFSSGSALILRGDQAMQDGNETPEAAKKALADGYLRVVLMYTDAPVAAQIRPEALYKAAQCFEKLGQANRAEALRGELKKTYASSPWAAK